MRRLPLAPCLALALLWTGRAHATTVAVLSPPNPSADAVQALTLLRGELLSVGLEVQLSERTAAFGSQGDDSVAWLEAFAETGVSAVINAIGDGGLQAVEVWVMKTHPKRFEVTRVAVDPSAPRPAEMLALRAVEALRASLVQLDWAERKRRAQPVAVAPAAPLPPNPAPARVEQRLGVEAGAVGIMSFDGVGPSFLSTFGVGWVARPWLLVRASLAALGSSSLVSTGAGRARVAQQYAVVGACYRFRPADRLWPFVGLQAGVLHTSVEGQDGAGTSGHTAQRWSGAADMSVGTGLRLHGRWYLSGAAHIQMAVPYVAVRIVDQMGASVGRPNLVLGLTVGAWL